MLYSIVETAKANDLKVYDYLEYLINKLANHAEDTHREKPVKAFVKQGKYDDRTDDVFQP